MKKNGFTLVELLVVLGIIGIITVLVTPQLVNNGQKQANATRLANIVADLDNGIGTLVAEEGATNLFNTTPWKNLNESLDSSSSENNISSFIGDIEKHLKITGFDTGGANNYYSIGPFGFEKQAAGKIQDLKTFIPISLKNGATLFVKIYKTDETAKDQNKILSLNGALYKKAATVMIDVNGKSKPNMVGRDLFGFILGSDGVLYPIGGKDTSIYTSQDESDMWSSNSGSYSCTNSRVSSPGWGCTGRLVEESFTMTY